MKGRLVSVQVGQPLFLGPDVGLEEPLNHRWHSAFFKEPVAGPVRLGRTNLDGDRQADPRVHGGPDMAVLAYSAEHYPLWREELGIAQIGPGGFAENFTISGQDELTVSIGDVYRVGGALVQVSQPRGPCYKISYRWKRPDLLGRCESNGRHGWYLRVLEEGPVEAGDAVDLLERPNPGWTVRRAADAYRARRKDRVTAAELARIMGYATRPAERILTGR
ncbi:MAG TPA: MOSC domain-containing protein [Candidatus Dormibacteraeota bacterium]|nr:MOSC domain-containing protein [Candidatus Dormibacteraeota bacterium]